MHRIEVNLAAGAIFSLKLTPLPCRLPVKHLMPRRAVLVLVHLVLDLVNPLALQHASTGRAIRQAPSLVLADGLHLIVHRNVQLSRFWPLNCLRVRHGRLVSNQAHRQPVFDWWSSRSAASTQRVLRAVTTLIVIRQFVISIVLLVILVVIFSIYGFDVACRTQARLAFDNLVCRNLL